MLVSKKILNVAMTDGRATKFSASEQFTHVSIIQDIISSLLQNNNNSVCVIFKPRAWF